MRTQNEGAKDNPVSSVRIELEAENRRLKTLVQEGRATEGEEIRLAEVRTELANLVGKSKNR